MKIQIAQFGSVIKIDVLLLYRGIIAAVVRSLMEYIKYYVGKIQTILC